MAHSRCCLARAAIVFLAAAALVNCTAPELLATSVGNVFVIAMENHNFTQPGSYTTTQALLGNSNAPYLNSLITPGNPNAAQASYATNYLSVGSVGHPSETNYIWMEAGSNLGVTTNNDPYGSGGNNQSTTQHLSALLAQAGISWKSYQEDTDMNLSTGAVLAQSSWTVPLSSFSGTMPAGATANAYNGKRQYDYGAKHNPQVFFTDTNGGNNSTTSNTQRLNYAPLQQLQTDLTNNTVSRYTWITPDQFNDMHTTLSGGFTYNGNNLTGDAGRIAQGDNFLSIVVPQIMSSQAYQNNGAILIWFDETEGGDTSNFTIPYILISPLAKGNAYQSTVTYTHSSTLKTLQEIFQVGGTSATGFLGGAATATDQADMFQSGVIPTGQSTWTGGGGNGNWSTTSNWNFSPTSGNSLVFAGTTQTSTTNDNLTSVSSITFSGNNSFSLSGNALTVSGGITNSSSNTATINLDLTLSAAQQFNSMTSDGLTINGTVANGGNLLTVNGSSPTKLNGNVSGAGGMVKVGLGSLTLAGNNSYGGGTTVNGGTLIAGHFNGLGSGGLAVTNSATAKLSNGLGNVVLTSVNLNGGSATPTATFDIGNNSVIIPYSGASPFATIQTQLLYASHNLAFDRPGITSSAADGFSTAVGYAEANELFIDGGGTYVNNQSPRQSGANTVIANQAVILKTTWLGDNDLNGTVDSTDFSNLFSNFGLTSGADWAMGDTDGNGTVDSTDFSNLFGNIGASGLVGGDSGPVSVPEPSTLVLAALGLAGMAAVGIRRRRKA